MRTTDFSATVIPLASFIVSCYDMDGDLSYHSGVML